MLSIACCVVYVLLYDLFSLLYYWGITGIVV